MTGARRALVTGATGFVGSHLARHLGVAGWEVHALVRGGSRGVGPPAAVLHTHDGSTGGMVGIVGAARPDVVFHVAGAFVAEHATEDVAALVESNLLLGTQLAEAMRVHGRTLLVNTGTAWQHYEDEAYNPVCLYAATKQAYVDVLRFFEEAAGLSVITLEIFDSYGPSDPRPKLMGVLSQVAREGGLISLNEGGQQLELVHVRDIARAYERAGERLLAGEVRGHECYAIRSAEPRTVREVVEIFGRVAGRPLDADWGAREYRVREMLKPWAGGHHLPGWRPDISLEEGIRELLAEVRPQT